MDLGILLLLVTFSGFSTNKTTKILIKKNRRLKLFFGWINYRYIQYYTPVQVFIFFAIFLQFFYYFLFCFLLFWYFFFHSVSSSSCCSFFKVVYFVNLGDSYRYAIIIQRGSLSQISTTASPSIYASRLRSRSSKISPIITFLRYRSRLRGRVNNLLNTIAKESKCSIR